MKESMETMKQMMEVSIFEVFEKMFFIFLEHSGYENSHYDHEASIKFNGNVRGEVRLFVSNQIARAMVMNMLGVDNSKIAEKDIEDCSKEAVNMICGNFIAKLNNNEQTFDLTIPVYHQPPVGMKTASATTGLSYFTSDDGTMSTSLLVYLD